MTLLDRMDSWVNALTGLGGLRDKLTHTRVVSGARLGDSALEALYNDDDLARKIVDKVPREATRRGFAIKVEGIEREEGAAKVRAQQQQFKRLRAMQALRQAWIWGRLYGCGAVLVGADDGQDISEPLDEDRLKSVRWLSVVRKMQLTVATRYADPTSAQYGEPQMLNLHPIAPNGGVVAARSLTVHESRLILFPGALAARMYTPSLDGWDDSMLQRVHDVLRANAVSWQAVSHLMTDASQGVFKIKGLINQLVAKDGAAALQTRMQMLDMSRSVARAILVDADAEDFERKPTTFAGIPELLDRFMMRVASAAEMPVTVLFGRSPAGLNATGESDVRAWYDTVQDAQTDVLQPRLERLLHLCLRAADSPMRGIVDDAWEVCFPPLWQPTDKERAETNKAKSEAVTAMVREGVMLDAEAAITMAEDYPAIDVEARQRILAAELEHAEELARNPPDPPAPDDPPDDPPEE
jgi:phage-related protein (TIGR01555 family)